MGRKIYIIRRKIEAKCWDDQAQDVEKLFKFCPCTEADWECDFGFDKIGSECVPFAPKYEINT